MFKRDPDRVDIILTLVHMKRSGKRKRIGWKVIVWALNQIMPLFSCATGQIHDPVYSTKKWDSWCCRGGSKAAKYGKCSLIHWLLLMRSRFAFFPPYYVTLA